MHYKAFDLRPYQDEAIYNLSKAYLDGLRKVAIVMATGLGKTVVAANFISQWDIADRGKVMVLCHREKLCEQLYGAIESYNKQKHFMGLEQGPNKCKGYESIVVGTVQSMSKRIDRYDLSEFGLLFIDEAHHNSSASSQYNKIIKSFEPFSDVFQVNLTATYQRADGVGFSDRCEKIVYEYPLLKAVDDGYLIKPVPYGIGIKGLRFESKSANFTDADMDRVLTESEKNIKELAAKIIKFCKGQKSLIFMQTQRLCERLCDAIRAHPEVQGKADFVHGDLHRDQKLKFFDGVASGDTTYAIGCDMLIEGFDWPECMKIVVVKPIGPGAISRLVQIAGRGTRPLPEVAAKLGDLDRDGRRALIAESPKSHLPILDLVGFSETHSFVTCSSIDGKILSKAMYNEIAKIAEELPEAVSMEELERQAKENLERKQREEEERITENARRSFGIYATAVIEEYRKEGVSPPSVIEEDRFLPVEERPTLDQIKWLRSRGLFDPEMTRKQAGKLMAAYFAKTPAKWVVEKISAKYPEFSPAGLDPLQADAIMKILDDRGWVGPLPKIERYNVSLKRSDRDQRYRVYVRDGHTGREVQVSEPMIVGAVAKRIARKISGAINK